jgi:hypothetical protein
MKLREGHWYSFFEIRVQSTVGELDCDGVVDANDQNPLARMSEQLRKAIQKWFRDIHGSP